MPVSHRCGIRASLPQCLPVSHTRRAVRAVRAVLFAVVCVSLAGAGHALSSSHPVPPWVLLAALPPVAVAAWCAAGRARGTAAIGAGLVAAQLVLHLVLTEAHALPGHAPEPHHSGTDARHMATAAAGWAPPTDTLSMTAAHLLAALGCAWWLACGERAVVQLAHATLAALLRPFRRPVPVRLPQRPPGRPAVAVDEQPAAVRLLRHAVSRRGPPGAYGRSPHAPYGAARAGLLLPMPRSVRP
ncbi:hypothetical protein C0Q98_01980 [Streptomyces albidoflavus]|nr:hypothetical protein Salbus254_0460 [Streptomyces albidoflavus]RZE66167.1 hypothetical protein C0Q98_01980 [Streptomyces albidoflavus]